MFSTSSAEPLLNSRDYRGGFVDTQKQAEHNTLLVFVVEINGSRLSASARGKAAFIYNLFCASVQPDTGRARSGLHSPYLRHKIIKKQAEHNTLLVFVVEIRGVEPLTS